MKPKLLILILLAITFSCTAPVKNKEEKELTDKIRNDEYFAFTKQKATEIMKTGFNAGDGYREVWIRDYNTFIELAGQVFPKEELKENLLVFFRMQGEDGNIIDGFTPAEKISQGETDFSYSKLEPRYAAHKNTVETDQESSLVQAVYKYIQLTGDSMHTIIGNSPTEILNLQAEFPTKESKRILTSWKYSLMVV